MIDEKDKIEPNMRRTTKAPDIILTPLEPDIDTSVKPSNDDIRKKLKDIDKQLAEINRKLITLDRINGRLDQLEDINSQLDYIRKYTDAQTGYDFDMMYHNVLEQMNIEAIKIYRNIQAVIVEENAKQNHVLLGVDGKTGKLKFRLNHVMIVSIVSFVVSILVMLMQILPALGINLFK